MTSPASASLQRSTALALAVVAGLLLGILLLAGIAAGGAVPPAAIALGLFAGTALLVWRGLPAHAPHRRFGAANAVTLGRAATLCALAGLLAVPPLADPDLLLVGIVAALLLLADGVDGWLARRSALASPFGARFDMETDAAFMAVLSLLLASHGRVGAWILLSGALRPLFILAGRLYPPLAVPPPPRQRRRTIAVIQGAGLALAFLPLLTPLQAACAAGFGLIAAAASFAIDTVWLLRHRNPGRDTPS